MFELRTISAKPSRIWDTRSYLDIVLVMLCILILSACGAKVTPAASTTAPSTTAPSTSAPGVTVQTPLNGALINAANQKTVLFSGTCGAIGQSVALTIVGITTNIPCTSFTWSKAIDLSPFADGTYTVSISQNGAAAGSGAGASGQAVTTQITVTKKTSIPSLAIQAPDAGTLISSGIINNFQVSGICSENGQNVVASGAATGTALCTNKAFSMVLSFATASDGPVSVTYTLSDAAGNSALVTRSYSKNSLSPTLSITTPDPSTWVNAKNQTVFAIGGNCSENGLSVTISGSATSTVTCSQGSWTAPLDFSGAGDGVVTITASHTNASSVTASTTQSYNKKTTTPAVVVSAPSANAYINSTNLGAFAISGTCSENGLNVNVLSSPAGSFTGASGCLNSVFSGQFNFAQIADGPVTLILSQTDIAGNFGSATLNLIKDSTVPQVKITSPPSGTLTSTGLTVGGTCTSGLPVILTGDINSGPVSATCSNSAFQQAVTLSGADGVKQVVATQTKASGSAATDSRYFARQTLGPQLTQTMQPSTVTTATSSVTFGGKCSPSATSFTVSQTDSGNITCTNGSWTYQTLAVSTDGTYPYTFTQSDAAGNSSSISVTWIRDTTGSGVSITYPANSATVAPKFTISGTCTGATVSISGPLVGSPVAAACKSGTYTTEIANSGSNGPITVTVQAGSDTAIANYTVDVNVPVLNQTLLVPPILANTSTVTFGGDCTNGITINISGQDNTTATCTANAWTYTTNAQTTDGTYAYTFSQTSSTGATTTVTNSWTRKTSIPIIGFATPLPGSMFQTTLTITGYCDSTIPTIVISGGGLLSPATASCAVTGTFSQSIFLTANDSTNKAITVSQTDGAGNVGTSTRIFTKKTTLPNVTIISPSNAISVQKNSTVTGLCDNTYTSQTVLLSGDFVGSPLTVACNVAGGGSYTQQVTWTSPDGPKALAASQSDPAGNIGTTSVQVTRLSIPPLLTQSVLVSPVTSGLNTVTFGGSCATGITVKIAGADTATTTCSSTQWSYTTATQTTDGLYSYTFSQQDAAGNITSVPGTWIRNSSAAGVTIEILNPVANTPAQNGVTISGNCQTSGGTITVTGNLTPGSQTTTCLGGTFLLPVVFSATDGSKTVTVTQGAATSSRAFIKKTSMSPLIGFTSPTTGAYTQGPMVITGVCETGDNVTITGQIMNAPIVTGCVGGTFSQNVAFTAPDGLKQVTVAQTDLAGNAQSAALNVNLQATQPSLTFTQPSQNSYVNSGNKNSYLVALTCSEINQPIVLTGPNGFTQTLTCSSSGSVASNLDLHTIADSAPASFVIKAVHSNLAGVTVTAGLLLIKKTVAPILTFTSPTVSSVVSLTNMAAFVVSGTCSEPGQIITFSGSINGQTACSAGSTFSSKVDFTAVADGPVNIAASITDVALNTSTQGPIAFTKDTVAPTLDFGAALLATTTVTNNLNSATFTGDCTNGLSIVVGGGTDTATATCSSGLFTYTTTTQTTDSSTRQYTFTQTSAHGNATTITGTWIRDTGGPKVNFTSPAANTMGQSGLTVKGTCTLSSGTVTVNPVQVAGSGVQTPVTAVCNGGLFSAPILFTAVDGTKFVTISQSDNAGNTTTQNRSFIRNNLAPSIAFTAPANNAYVTPSNIILTGTCTNGLAISLDSVPANSFIGSPLLVNCVSGTFSQTITMNPPDAAYIISATQTDAAGNSGQSTVTLNTLSTYPTLTVLTPTAGAYINAANKASFTVSGACSENGFAVSFTAPGGFSDSVNCASKAFSKALDLHTLFDGPVVLTVSHINAAGTSSQLALPLTKSTTLPSSTILSPTVATYANKNNQSAFSAFGTCTDTGQWVDLKATDTASHTTPVLTVPCLGASGLGTWSALLDLKTPGLVDGNITLSSQARDSVSGNIESSTHSTVVFPQNTVPPTFTLTQTPTGSSAGPTFAFSGTCTNGLTIKIGTDWDSSGVVGTDIGTTTCSGGTWNYTTQPQVIAQKYLYRFSQTSTPDGNTTGIDPVWKISNGGPVVQITSPAAGTRVNNTGSNKITIAGNCDASSGTITITSVPAGATPGTTSCAGGGTFTQLMTLPAGADGVNTITVKQTNGASQTGQDARAFYLDTTAPTLTVVSPAGGSTQTNPTFTIQGACSEANTMVTILGNTASDLLNSPVTTMCSSTNTFTVSGVGLAAPDGAKTLKFFQTDLASNTNTAVTLAVTRALAIPTITFTAPAAGSYVNIVTIGSVTISGTCSASAIGQPITLSIGGQSLPTVNCTGTGFTLTQDISKMNLQGPVAIVGTLLNSGGMPGTGSVSITVDTVSPSVHIQKPATTDIINVVNQTAFTASGTCSEVGQPVNVSAGTGTAAPAWTVTAPCLKGNTWSISTLDFSSIPDGTKIYIKATQTDLAGNPSIPVNDGQPTVLTKDTVVPIFTESATPLTTTTATNFVTYGGTCTNGLPINVQGTDSNQVTCVSGNWTYQTQIQKTDNTAPGYTYTFYQKSLHGNTTSITTVWSRQTFPPIVTVLSPIYGTVTKGTITVSGTCSGKVATVQITGANLSGSPVSTACTANNFSQSLTFTGADATETITLSQTDAAGNSSPQSWQVVKSNAAPNLTILTPIASSYFNGPTAITGDCVANSQILITGNITISPLTATCGANNKYSQNVTFTSPDGAKSISLSETDAAGNVATKSVNVNLKTTAPYLVFTAPLPGTFVGSSNQSALQFTGNCDSIGQPVTISIPTITSQTPPCSAGGTFTATFNLSSLATGDFSVAAQVTDVAGNVTQTALAMSKPASTAGVKILYPTATSGFITNANKSAFSVGGTCAGVGGGGTISFSGGFSGTTSCGSGNWSTTVNVSGLADGPIVLNVQFTDGAANVANATVTVTKDTSPPTAPSLISYTPTLWFNQANQSPMITWVASSDGGGSGIDHYEIALGSTSGNNDIADYVPVGLPLSSQLGGLFLNQGSSYYASVRAVDKVGNKSASGTGPAFKIDVIPPTAVASLTLPTSFYITTATPTLTWTASTDADSGVNHYELAIGTQPGLTDVLNFSSTGSSNLGNVLTGQATGLNLQQGTTYYPSIRAVDLAGNTSAVTQGANGWSIAAVVPFGKAIYTYTGSASTFTVPAGVTSLWVKAWGAGGGGGYTGGAGGGGAYTLAKVAVTPGQSYSVMVGGGGQSQLNASTTQAYGGGGTGVSAQSNNPVGGGGGRTALILSSNDVVTSGGGAGALNNTSAASAQGGQSGSLLGTKGAGFSATAGSDGAGGGGGYYGGQAGAGGSSYPSTATIIPGSAGKPGNSSDIDWQAGIGVGGASNGNNSGAVAAPGGNGLMVIRWGDNPYEDLTTLALHMDGTNGSSVFTDMAGHAIQSSGNAQISTVQPKYGTGSVALSGGGTDYVYAANTTGDFAFGKKDFTVQTWVYFNNNPADAGFIQTDICTSGCTGQFFMGYIGGQLKAGAAGDANNTVSAAWSPASSTWYFLQAVRQNGTLTLYVNGASIGSGAVGNLIQGAGIQVGAIAGTPSIVGNMDEVLVINGAAQPLSVSPNKAFSISDFSTCKDAKTKGSTADGIYLIDPGATGTTSRVFCDMTTDGGGWSLLITLTGAQTPYANLGAWPSSPDLNTTSAAPTVSGMYKGSMAPFTEIREVIAGGAQKVYAKNLASAAQIRDNLYVGVTRAATPGGAATPNCRTTYAGATDNVAACSAYSSSTTGYNLVIGFQWDVNASTCTFGSSNIGGPANAGSALCPGAPNGTQWSKVWFR